MRQTSRWLFLLTCILLSLTGVLCVLGIKAAHSEDSYLTVPLLLPRIEAKAKTLKTLRGQFKQHKFTRLLASPIESQGFFYWQPPDRFRWEVTHPAPFTLVTRGDAVLVYTPDLKRATLYRHHSGDGLLGRIIGSDGGIEEFRNTYYMQITPTPETEDHHWVQLQLEPRSYRQARYLKRVEVLIDQVNWLPQKVTITEANGDWSEMRLLDLTENADLADELFNVQPPAGVQTRQVQGHSGP